jgi:hypothetical protein
MWTQNAKPQGIGGDSTYSDTHYLASYSAAEIADGILVSLRCDNENSVCSDAVCDFLDLSCDVFDLNEIDKGLGAHLERKLFLLRGAVYHDWTDAHGLGKLHALDTNASSAA